MSETKQIPANQKALDALPMNSGMWRVDGVPGLYVRCRAQSKSFLQQRRVDGILVKKVLGQLSMKEAKEKATTNWSVLKPGKQDQVVPLDVAIETYLKNRKMMGKIGDATERVARYNFKRYLVGWKSRTMREIGADRAQITALHTHLTERYGRATCNQVFRLLRAVYQWYRDRIDAELPEWPKKAAEMHTIPARNWAYSTEELKKWWEGVEKLGTTKRMWWLTVLLTGARQSGALALKWNDIDLEKKFAWVRVNKRNPAYCIPIGDMLVELLKRYKAREDVLPTENGWLFPSPKVSGRPLGMVNDTRKGLMGAHHLRHTFRTTLAQLGVTREQAKMLMGHSLGGGDVSDGYISPELVAESLRPAVNALANRYIQILPEIVNHFK